MPTDGVVDDVPRASRLVEDDPVVAPVRTLRY
jgi:hypothetical protein